jgi:hypothetical protein
MARIIYWIERWHQWREDRRYRQGLAFPLYARLKALQRRDRW